jgi:hypothetical protein
MGLMEPWNEDIASGERFGCQALRLSFVDQAEGFGGAVEDAGACASSISSVRTSQEHGGGPCSCRWLRPVNRERLVQ